MSRHTIRSVRWFERVVVSGVRPLPAAIGGTVAAVLIGLVVGRLGDELARASQALILVVPVVVSAVLGGRRAAYVVAASTTIVFSMLIPPVGSVRVRVAQDLIALAVFSAVALVIGTLVAGRIEILGRVERQRAVLLRSVSHDLRTPLASIRAAASEVLAMDHDPQTRRKLLELVGNEAERLDRLVANLLSLSRIEAGALTPRRQPVDLGELIGASSERLASSFAERPLAIDVPDDLPILHADYTQLEQVVTNLLENAARHTPPGSSVAVSAMARDDGVSICVADSGPGVDPAEAHAIFEPFRLGPGSVTGSSGIGLAICKAIVDAHGGAIVVDANPGGGARFTVTLPRG